MTTDYDVIKNLYHPKANFYSFHNNISFIAISQCLFYLFHIVVFLYFILSNCHKKLHLVIFYLLTDMSSHSFTMFYIILLLYYTLLYYIHIYVQVSYRMNILLNYNFETCYDYVEKL